jgi:hypothetical protein
MARPAGPKTLAIQKALSDNPRKSPSEISAMLKEQGFDASPAYVGKIKYKMTRKGKKRRKTAAAPAPEAGPVVAKDAVSVALLCKAKKLVAQFSSIKEAKAAIAALAQIMD